MSSIYAGYESTVQYDEEAVFGTNPGGALTAIDIVQNISIKVDQPRFDKRGLGTRVRTEKPFLKHDASAILKGAIQNSTFISLWLDVTKSYTIPVWLNKSGDELFEELRGSYLDTLKVTLATDTPVEYEIGLCVRQWHDNDNVDPNASWAAEIGTALYTFNNTTIQKLIYVTGETPAGVINGGNTNFTTLNAPIADYDEDGNIDDVGDLITLTIDASDDLPPVSLDSSTGAFVVTTAPVATIVIDYIYSVDIPNILECTIEGSQNFKKVWNPYSSTNTSPELPRIIQSMGHDAQATIRLDMEDLTELDELIDLGVKTQASGSARLWGVQMKFGTSEAGDFKIRVKDGYWEPYSTDIAEVELLEDELVFTGDELVIF